MNLFAWNPDIRTIPFDTEVEVTDGVNVVKVFNQCYPPQIYLCRTDDLNQIDFVPTHWREVINYD